MSAKRRGSLTVGIVLCVLGVALAAGPGAASLAGGIGRGWPLLIAIAGGALLLSFAAERRPSSPVPGALLIAVGGLLFGLTTRQSGGPLELYGAMWPLFVGVVAVSELLRFYTHRPELGARPSIVTPGKIALVAVIAGTGLASARIAEANPSLLAGVHMPEFVVEARDHLFGREFELEPVSSSSRLAPGGAVELSNDFGDISLEPAAGDLLEVSIVPKVRAYDRGRAERIGGALRLVLTGSEQALTVGTNGDEVGDGVRSDMVVRVPRGASVRVASDHGDVKASGLELLALAIEAAHSDVRLEDLRADTQVEGSHSDVRVTGGEGTLVVRSSHTEVTMDSFRGDVVLDGVDDVKINRLTASRLALSAVNHAKVVVNGVTARGESLEVTASGRHTRFVFADVQGSLRVESSHGNLKASRITGDVTLMGEHTEVFVEGARAVRLATSYDGVKVIDPTGPVEIRNHHGRIDLRLPVGPSYAISDTVEHGDVRIDDAFARAASGSSAIPVTLETSYEDIVVKPSSTRVGAGGQ